MRIKRGQKRYESRVLPLRVCRQGDFYIFNQVSSFNLQQNYSGTYNRKNLRFFPLDGHQILSFYCQAHSCCACSYSTRSHCACPHHAWPYHSQPCHTWPHHARPCNALNVICQNLQRHANYHSTCQLSL
jgi:hypothetical protein